MKPLTNFRNKQTGNGILIAVISVCILAAVASASIMGGTGVASMVAGSNAANLVTAQAGMLRSRLQQCANDNPTGNNGGLYHLQYPRADTAALASGLTCPGNALGLWAWSDGVTMPSAVNGFGPWYYTNSAAGMSLSTVVSDGRTNLLPQILSALGPQAVQSGVSPSITLTWTIAN